jgi:hypothetical protein
MTTKQHVTEELSVGPARVRVDYHGTEPRAHILEDLDFFNYRLADVQISSQPSLAQPDIVWNRDAETSVSYDGHAMTFNGEWAPGPLQKAGVAMLALRLEEHGLHPFHASAVRYRDRTVMFLGGESNHGKSMCQIEACRRGALLVSTETTLVDETARAVMGSKTVFIKKRAQGTERADKAAPDRAVEIFFGSMPTWEEYEEPSTIDVVVVPAIDGNFDPSLAEMISFEKQFQALHSVQNYFLLNELLAPGWAMPILDTSELRRARAQFVTKFAERPYFMVRAATPQVLMDQLDKVL